MKKPQTYLASLLLILCFTIDVSAQPPFWNEIAEFKHRDRIQRPPVNAILFVGSSSFRKWTGVQNDFPGYPIINRGFGGSTLDDVIRYAGAIIYGYHPREGGI